MPKLFDVPKKDFVGFYVDPLVNQQWSANKPTWLNKTQFLSTCMDLWSTSRTFREVFVRETAKESLR